MSRKILKVVLQDDGLKGMIVFFEQPSKRLDMNFRDKHKVHYRAPVNKEITDLLETFKPHLITLNRLDADIAYEEIRITDVEAHDGWFKIGGKVRSVDEGEYTSRTKKIDDSGAYEGSQDATEKIYALYKEVRAYIKEKKVMDPMQMILNFSKTDKTFEEKFPEGAESMTEQEQKDYYRMGCEKMGMIVIEQEPESDPFDELIDEDDAADEIVGTQISEDDKKSLEESGAVFYAADATNPDQHEAAIAPVVETPGKIRQLEPTVAPKTEKADTEVKKKKFGS